jgi:hypothetical protein
MIEPFAALKDVPLGWSYSVPMAAFVASTFPALVDEARLVQAMLPDSVTRVHQRIQDLIRPFPESTRSVVRSLVDRPDFGTNTYQSYPAHLHRALGRRLDMAQCRELRRLLWGLSSFEKMDALGFSLFDVGFGAG